METRQSQVIFFSTQQLYEKSEDNLRWVARRARREGYSEKDVLLFCIAVDSAWRPLVDLLMPGQDWQTTRDRGEPPVAVGYVRRAAWVAHLVRHVPDLGPKFNRRLPKGIYHALVCAAEEANVAFVRPPPEVS